MRKIDLFYQKLRHNDPIEEQLEQSGIIKSYFVTTLNAMNARRNTDLCLWCDATWSIDHRCERAPIYNCRFSFGEDDDGMAFVQVSKEGLKHIKVEDSHVKALNTNADNMLDEMCVSDSCMKSAREMFDETPVPDFMLEMARAVTSVQENEELTDAHKMLGEMSEPISSFEEAQVVETATHFANASSQLSNQNDAENKSAKQINFSSAIHVTSLGDKVTQIAEVTSFERKLDLVNEIGDVFDYRFCCNLSSNREHDVQFEDYRPIFDHDELQSCVDKVGAQQYGTNDSDLLFECRQFCTGKSANRDKGLLLRTLSLVFAQIEVHTTYSCSGPLLSYLTLEDKGDLRGEEGSIYVRDTWVLIMDGISCHNCPLSQIDNSMSIPIRTFDPGGLAWDGCKANITWSDFVYGWNKLSAFLDSIYDPGGECHGMEAQMKVFDPGLIFMNKSRQSRYNGFEGQQLMANVFCEGGGELFPTYIFNLGDGCSLMGAYSLRRANDTSSVYWLFLLYEHYDSRYLKVKNTMAWLRRQNKAFIHDVAQLGTTPLCLWPAPQLAAQKSLSLPGAIALATLLPLVFLAPRHASATHAISFPWPSLVPSSASGQMKTSATDGFEPSNFVFDPGGKDSGPKMDKPQAYSWSNQRLMAIRRENHQTYVYDPGGSLTMYDIDEPRNASIITCL